MLHEAHILALISVYCALWRQWELCSWSGGVYSLPFLTQLISQGTCLKQHGYSWMPTLPLGLSACIVEPGGTFCGQMAFFLALLLQKMEATLFPQCSAMLGFLRSAWQESSFSRALWSLPALISCISWCLPGLSDMLGSFFPCRKSVRWTSPETGSQQGQLVFSITVLMKKRTAYL